MTPAYVDEERMVVHTKVQLYFPCTYGGSHQVISSAWGLNEINTFRMQGFVLVVDFI